MQVSIYQSNGYANSNPTMSYDIILRIHQIHSCDKGGGCGIGVGLGWGFGTAFGSKYRNSRVTFEGSDFHSKDGSKGIESKDLSKSTRKTHASQ